jgi:YD repeat-containing protein
MSSMRSVGRSRARRVGRCKESVWTRLIPLVFFAALALAFGPSSIASNVTYVYNSIGQLVQLTYDNGTVVTYGYDANGNRESAQVKAPALETPTNLVAAPASESEINLSWTGSSGASGYYIYACTGSGCTPTNQIANCTPCAADTYQDIGLAPSTTYVFAVQAYQGTGSNATLSAISAAASAETDRDSTPPSTPGTLTATASGSSIALSWGASTDNVGVQGYDLERCIGSGCTPSPYQSLTGTSYTDSGLSQVTTYVYRVRAFDAAGNYSGFSNTVSLTTPDISPPSIPQGLSATAANWSTVDLSWQASTDNVSVAGYKIYRNGSQIGTSGTTSYADSTTLPNTRYSYTVSAYDGAGNNSAQSGAAAVTTPSGPAPSAPSGLSATVAGDNLVNLSWSAASDSGGPGIGGYKIYRNGTEIGTSASTSFSDSGVAPFNTYSYTVAAYDKGGTTSPQSSAVSASTFYQITNSSGASVSSLYTSAVTVVGGTRPLQYYWHVNQAYSSGAVVFMSSQSVYSGVSSICPSASTQFIAAGYQRSGCVVLASPSVYGH